MGWEGGQALTQEAPVRSLRGVSPRMANGHHAGYTECLDQEGGAPQGTGLALSQKGQSGSCGVSRAQGSAAQLRPSRKGTWLPLISLLQNEDSHQPRMPGRHCKASDDASLS